MVPGKKKDCGNKIKIYFKRGGNVRKLVNYFLATVIAIQPVSEEKKKDKLGKCELFNA